MFSSHLPPVWNAFEAGLANHLWQSTVFAAAVAGLTLLFRKNSAVVRYRMWLIASLKFLIPFSLLVGIGGNLGSRIEPQFHPPALPDMVQQMGRPFVQSIVPASVPVSAEASALPAVLAVVWVLGAVAVLSVWCFRWWRVARAMRSASPFEGAGRFERVRMVFSSANVEPGVFGILRPVLLLPKDAATQLSPSQLEAIIEHEMFHIRGRDNLAAAMHTIVEAVFWFHPLVWWLGARLIDERERACDEAVLQSGCDPADYAEGILKVCECYLKAPACMAGVAGSNLRKRIEEIMNYRGGRKMAFGKRLLLISAGAGIVFVPLLAGLINASEVRAVSFVVTPAPLVQAAAKAVVGVVGQAPATARQQGPSSLQQWPEDVRLIDTDAERQAFRQLQKDEEREKFIETFWQLRDPTPGTPENEFRDEYYRRVAFANEHFATTVGVLGSQTDRGKMYTLNGPPDEIVSHASGGTYYRVTAEGGGVTSTFPFETWRYRHIEGKGDNVIYEFVDQQGNGEYRLEYDPNAKLK